MYYMVISADVDNDDDMCYVVLLADIAGSVTHVVLTVVLMYVCVLCDGFSWC